VRPREQRRWRLLSEQPSLAEHGEPVEVLRLVELIR
jgi:hypothetical protein